MLVCRTSIEQHGSTRSTHSTRRTCRVVSRRDVTSQVEFGLNSSALDVSEVGY